MRRWSATLALCAGLAAVGLPTAAAAPQSPSPVTSPSVATPCAVPQPVAQALRAYYDDGWYYLVTNGSFTNGTTGWRTSGAVSVNPQSAPQDVMGAGGGSLALAPGATATTQSFCTDADHDRTRFFYRSTGGTGTLQVRVTSTSSMLYARSYTFTTYLNASSTSWRLSPTLAIPNWTDASGQQQTTISFTAIGGTVLIDDVLVDPWKYHTN